MQRRKTLINGLMNSGIIKDREKLNAILKEANIDSNIREKNLQ